MNIWMLSLIGAGAGIIGASAVGPAVAQDRQSAGMHDRHITNVSASREPQSDVQLETAVMQAIRISALTSDSLIVAHAAKGEVTLQGSVLTQLAKREATRLAETVLGVTSIRNRLDVVGNETAGTE